MGKAQDLRIIERMLSCVWQGVGRKVQVGVQRPKLGPR